MSGLSALRCFECSIAIGYYSDNGAPHYHCYICPDCADKLKDKECEEED